jgi:GDPmannose 4,6-dehydratase
MKILLTGYPGQDATILLKLLEDEHEVHLLSKTSKQSIRNHKKHLICDFRESDYIASYCLKNSIEVIINCAALSSVQASWENPQQCFEINGYAVGGLLDSLDVLGYQGIFYQLGSTDMYGAELITDVNQLMRPWSPYGESKAYAHKAVQDASRLGMRAFNLVLTNHDSILRPRNYIIRKIAEEIHLQKVSRKKVELRLGNPKTIRDWAHAVDICKGIQMVIENKIQRDLIFATGISNSIQDLITEVGNRLGIAIEVRENKSLRRKNDLSEIRIINPNAIDGLGWRPEYLGADTLYSLVMTLSEK